ncbi:DUF262 domain-containing protein [Gluconobacter cerinus]|uniref:DUF262 domain-containing protein n=1 Tax=Gluconobacter cerinus TaxID=38307 RepID=UPI0030956DD5
MSLNALIQPDRPTVSKLVDGMRTKEVFVDNSFQRRLVWTNKQKVKLIETILIGYPMPEIYFWQQPADPETGAQKRSIVDGQQRLTTMLQFVSNEWPLKNSYLSHVDRLEEYSDKYWKDLSPELKRIFWDYVLTVRTIPSEVNEDQIRSIFRRLNETDRSLNPQELRNAEFNGKFIELSEKIADLDELSKLSVFSEHQVRRMADVEFSSSLLAFLRRGLVEDNLRTTNELYDNYNEIYEEADEDFNEISNFFRECLSFYFDNDQTKKMFTKPVHLYSLFCVIQSMKDLSLGKEVIRDRLDSFVEVYEGEERINPIIEKYREASSSRTKSRVSRTTRMNSLRRWMTDS